jgi:hypothetical protein
MVGLKKRRRSEIRTGTVLHEELETVVRPHEESRLRKFQIIGKRTGRGSMR